MTGKNIGRYIIRRELGDGGMGRVYLAYDPVIRRDVALKVIHGHLSLNNQFRLRFEREANVMASLAHPAIVPVYDFGQENGQLYLVMRLMKNGSLVDRLRDGPLSFDEATRLIGHLAPALDMAHQKGIVHRDLKPNNILFDQQNNPYITDFGIAKNIQSTSFAATQTGAVIGTATYMSPEQARGDKDIDGRSDIYSLGVILFEMLTGKPPYQANLLAAVIYQHLNEPIPKIYTITPNLPQGSQAIIDRTMAKNPEARYPSAGNIAAALKLIIERKKAETTNKEQKTSSWSSSVIDQIKKGVVVLKEMWDGSKQQPKPVFPPSRPQLPPTVWPSSPSDGELSPSIGTVLPSSSAPSPQLSPTVWPSPPADGEPLPDSENWDDDPTVLPFTPIPSDKELRSDLDDSKENLTKVTLISSPPESKPAEQTIIPVRTSSLGVFKKRGHLIEALIQAHIQMISAKLDKDEGTRLFLTGFGSFGGTSLVQATTAKLMENFRDNQTGKVLVIRFDTSDHAHSGEYQLLINENKVGFFDKFVNEKSLFAKIDQVLRRRAKSSHAQGSATFDFFVKMTAVFDQADGETSDSTYSLAITSLVCQLLNLLAGDYNKIQMREALDKLLATPSTNQARQVVLIIDRLEQAEAMERLRTCPIRNPARYPWLSLIVVARHEAFNRWPERLQRKIRNKRWMEYYYVERQWRDDFNLHKELNEFMRIEISVLNKQQRDRFDSLLAHLTYEARGSVARLIGELKKGQYLSKEGGDIVINIDAIYKQRGGVIEYHVRLQQILDHHWDKITGKGLLSRVEMADQAKIGVYHMIEWMREKIFFDKEELLEAARQQEITISDNKRVRKKVLNNLLRVLERNGYLKHGSEADSYELAGLDHPSEESDQLSSEDATSPDETVIDQTPDSSPPPIDEDDDAAPLEPPVKPLHYIAFLGDATLQADNVISLATQIAFEVAEAGYALIMTDRGGVNATVWEKLVAYCGVAEAKRPLLIATGEGVRSNEKQEVIPASNPSQQLEEFLKKADVLILAQQDGTTDSVFAPQMVKLMAEKENVPVIERSAKVDLAEVPNVAREVVKEAEKAYAARQLSKIGH